MSDQWMGVAGIVVIVQCVGAGVIAVFLKGANQ